MSWFEKIFQKKRRIFLDYASATPVLPEAKFAMEKFWSENFHNPSAIYEEGVKVKEGLARFRARVANLLGIVSTGIVFTSGGTESDNLAVLGAFEEFKEERKLFRRGETRPHLVISATEHPAVMAAAAEVVRRGGEVSIVEVNEGGMIAPEKIKKVLRHNTFLVSVSLVNNEIGTIAPIPKIGRLVREHRKNRESRFPYLHTDASQAPGFLDVNLEALQTDMLTLDSAKIYGPKGVGILALRKGVSIKPLFLGGGQEDGRRSGTVNTALVAGFVLALEMAVKDRDKETLRLGLVRKNFVDLITKNLPEAIFNGAKGYCLPSIVSISIPGILAEFVLLKLDRAGVLASAGSACSLDGRESGSPVIRAIGKADLSESTLRFSFGRFTSPEDAKLAAKIFCQTIRSVVK